jgi:radical SAM protein with 4Fe4S-binding SPASM domain
MLTELLHRVVRTMRTMRIPIVRAWETVLQWTVAAEDKAPTTARDTLLFLDIELTERCCLCCRHCYIRRPRRDLESLSREMPFHRVCRFLQEAVQLGCKQVRFTGGEPLVRADFTEIYEYAYDLGLLISLATNGILITDKVAEVFARRKPKSVSVSIYGWDSTSYDRTVNVPGSFEAFLCGVDKLRKNGIPFRMRYPALRELVDNRDEIHRATRRLGASGLLPYAWELTLHAWNERESCERIAVLRLTPREAATEMLKEPGIAATIREKLSANVREQEGAGSLRMFNCPAGRARPTLNAYGQLQPCLQVRHPGTLYDLEEGSLSNAVTQHFPRIRQMRTTNPVFLERCGRCQLRPACPQCPACAWMEYGTLDQPADYYCEVMHASAELLGLIKQGEKAWKMDALRPG